MLQSLMPEVFDEGKIDWEKLKATLGEEVNFANERYVLNWAGKSDAFRIMQQSSSATLVPCREESVDFDQTENLFIEGENMEVLKVLQKSYFGKVKMIYIDPPYNTGNDSFINTVLNNCFLPDGYRVDGAFRWFYSNLSGRTP